MEYVSTLSSMVMFVQYSFYIIRSPIYRVGQKSVPVRWVLYHRRVLYLRVVALQMAYCTYLFEDCVTKKWKFDFWGHTQSTLKCL